MSVALLVAPVAEPLGLVEAKSFLRVEHEDDDVLIASLAAAARNHVEAMTRRGLMLQTWRITLDAWPPDGRIRPKIGPLRAVIAARVFDAAGNPAVIDAGGFAVDTATDVIALLRAPLPGRARAGIEIDIEIGFGADAADVPAVLRQAMRTLVAHWYENRGLVAIGGRVAMMPLSVHAMVSSFRVLSL